MLFAAVFFSGLPSVYSVVYSFLWAPGEDNAVVVAQVAPTFLLAPLIISLLGAQSTRVQLASSLSYANFVSLVCLVSPVGFVTLSDCAFSLSAAIHNAQHLYC